MKITSLFSRGSRPTYTIGGVRYEVVSNSYTEKICIDLLSLPSVALGIDVKSNDVAKLPMRLYLKTNAGRERLESQFDYRLSVQPNDYTNAFQFWKQVAMQAIVGEACVLFRDNRFTLLPFGQVVKYTTPAGEVRYAELYPDDEAKAMNLPGAGPHIKADYAWREVLHFYESVDEQGRVLPLRVRFKAMLGLGSDVASYSCNLYNRGGVLAGYLSTDQKMPEPQKKDNIKWFKKLFKTPVSETDTDDSDLKITMLDGGTKFTAMNLTPQEMMVAEAKKDFTRDVAAMLHMPLWKLGILDDYKYASAEQAARDYLQQSLDPLLTQIEREINVKCIADFERPYLYAEFNREKAVTIDAKTMAEVDDMAVKTGGMSLNEWRARRNLPAVPGGDIRQVPVNVTSAAYVERAEALKIQKLELENQKLQAELSLAKPTPAPAPVAAEDLTAMQAELAATPITADNVASIAAATAGKIAARYGLPTGALDKFATAYAEAAAKRLGTTSNVYEANRLINAANFEAIGKARGINSQLKWVGGALAGQVRKHGEAWGDTAFKHPPLAAEQCDCFVVLA